MNPFPVVSVEQLNPAGQASAGEVPGLMRLHVGKDEVSETVLGLLKIAPVADLAVEEEDLGNIIDALQTRRGQA